MKSIRLARFWTALGLMLGLGMVQGDQLTDLTVTPANPPQEQFFEIHVGGWFGYFPVQILSSTNRVIGNIIQIEVLYYYPSQYGFPVVVDWGRTETIVPLPAGLYTVNASLWNADSCWPELPEFGPCYVGGRSLSFIVGQPRLLPLMSGGWATNGLMSFGWTGCTGLTYAVQSCRDLEMKDWRDIPGWTGLSGNGATICFTNPVPQTSPEFYRVTTTTATGQR